MTNDIEEAKIVYYIDNLLQEYVNEYENVRQKCLSCQVNLDGLNQRLSELTSKFDNTYDYFSPSGKIINLEREKIELQISSESLNMDNYTNQCSIYLNKIECIKAIKNYTSDFMLQNNKLEAADDQLINNYGLKILETQENERARIASDLHDSTVQNLTNLVHRTELCQKLLDIDLVRAKLELQLMIETIRETINDMRSIIYDLRPMSIDDLGLNDTINRYINKLKKDNDNVEIVFSYQNEEPEVSSVVKITLYRIIQEACSNVLQHAKAEKININLLYTDENISLAINDNGIGFEYNNQLTSNENKMSFGLSIMCERVYLLSGSINIKSQKNEGTEITVTVPLK